MYNNGYDADYHNDGNVRLAEREQADAIKSNLDKILHYERYRGNEQSAAENYVEPIKTAAPLRNEFSAPEREEFREETSEYLRPSSTTMQFGTSEENDVYEDVAYDRQSEKEEFKLSNKGKILIAVYSLVVAIILSLIVINSRMLKSLDKSISSNVTEIESLTAQLTKVTEECNRIMSEEEVAKWAAENGMKYEGQMSRGN